MVFHFFFFFIYSVYSFIYFIFIFLCFFIVLTLSDYNHSQPLVSGPPCPSNKDQTASNATELCACRPDLCVPS
ncbi:hypothetical protein BDV24DRAFT_123912 [Aspergillus arachidicola]|uniref:Uncharacterized protein n=1 Tax=Aspergillus arachidicola TaxID=656916 RepID=A0A5N6YM35_9EURO|nr:hypothetical protein BDV24DRAFT_123912 [Aspergillus arachidicola]